MANIRIKNLPADATPNKNDRVPLDNATTRSATIEALVNVGRPFASQAEAEAGIDATKAMNPLTTKQALAAQGALVFQPFSPVLSATTASFTTLDETKLDGVEDSATANSADTTLLARENHTGTQAISTVAGLQAVLDASVLPAIQPGDAGKQISVNEDETGYELNNGGIGELMLLPVVA